MQVGRLHTYRELYIEEAVECLDTRQIMPSPSAEKSHGIAPDYRCSVVADTGVAVEVIGDEQTLPRYFKYQQHCCHRC